MMSFDDEELEIVIVALRLLRDRAANAPDGTGDVVRRCCDHVSAKADLLVDRINQHQQDRRNGDA